MARNNSFNFEKNLFLQKELHIKCSDGFELTATLFEPKEIKGAVMIAPATGIKQQFYFSFAKHLAENGFAAITFDNRGIAKSRGKDFNKIGASLVNWGRLDMTAILEKLKELFPETQYHLVGHSAGGQLVGLMENAHDLSSIFNYACSSGSIRNLNYPFKAKGVFLLNVVVPLSNMLFGHAKSQWFGMGEPLPKLVAAQWRAWCNGKGYVETAFGKEVKDHFYNSLTLPSYWIHATDDDIANAANVRDMVRVYSKSKATIVSLDPAEFGFTSLGHMKFFSSKKSQLWKYATDWLKNNSV